MKTAAVARTEICGWKSACAVLLFCALGAIASSAQTFTKLLDFDQSNGSFEHDPSGQALVQGADGNFYGTTPVGGAYGYGTVFEITSTGTLTTLYSFCPESGCADGYFPLAGLVLGTDGNFYGSTEGGGSGFFGTVFKITAEGAFTTIFTFPGTAVDGGLPYAALVEGVDGNLYGTTVDYGGLHGSGSGTVFTMTRKGKMMGFYSFTCATDCPAAAPYGSLVQASNGAFYGTTRYGGPNGGGSNGGTAFTISVRDFGSLNTLHNFGSQGDGAQPYSGLLLANDGNFYGTTIAGGAHYGTGTIFKMDGAGNVTRLYSFCTQTNCTDGSHPYSALIQATDGNFYGTTANGGAHGYGTIFMITPSGTLATLHSFDITDGAFPQEALVQGTDGIFYGISPWGGSAGLFSGIGTIFSLDVGLGPFARTNPTSGGVGTSVVILGNNLTGTTAVSFNGVAATFTVVSATEITATVPAGATTGLVSVAAPGGTLTSNVNFRVTP